MIEVRREVMSVVQPVEMVKIRLVEKRVSPTGPRAKKHIHRHTQPLATKVKRKSQTRL